MIKSMTGFGRCEITEGEKRYTVEMKSVNHRYLEMNIKMPKALNFFESSIRTELKKYMERGKVDLYITYEDLGEESGALKYNSALAKEYMNSASRTMYGSPPCPDVPKYSPWKKTRPMKRNCGRDFRKPWTVRPSNSWKAVSKKGIT